jgi:hypothetical protein
MPSCWKLVRIEGMMDGAKCREILEGNLFQSSRDLRLEDQRNQSDLKELEQFCREEWAKIPVARCAKLKETYPKRLAALIAAKGGSRPGNLETIGDWVDATQDLVWSYVPWSELLKVHL